MRWACCWPVVITAASVQDRDAARPLLWNLHRASRHIRLIWADAVYTGKLSAWAASMKIDPVHRRPPAAAHLRGAAPPLGRGADIRLDQQAPPVTVRDYETLPASHEATTSLAMIALMTRRLAGRRIINLTKPQRPARLRPPPGRSSTRNQR